LSDNPNPGFQHDNISQLAQHSNQAVRFKDSEFLHLLKKIVGKIFTLHHIPPKPLSIDVASNFNTAVV
jgi:hypothetical protein